MRLWFLIVFLHQRAGGDYSGLLSETVILCGSAGSHYFPAISSKSFSWAGGWFFPWSLFISRSGVSLFYLCLFSCASWLIPFFLEYNFITSCRYCPGSTWGHCKFLCFLSPSSILPCSVITHFAANMPPPPPPDPSSVGLAAGGRTWKMPSVAAVPDRSAMEGQMVFD